MENLSIPQTKVLNNDTILHLEDVSFSYHSLFGETDVLKNLSFSVKEGEFIAIVGPSGCGKSTLLNIICGLLKIKSGKRVLAPDTSIGYMLQHDHLFEWRTIYENVTLGLEIQNQKTPENEEYVLSLLENYGLLDFKDKRFLFCLFCLIDKLTWRETRKNRHCLHDTNYEYDITKI